MRTGFAVRQGLEVSRNPDLVELNVSGYLRHGTDITLTVGGTPIRLLSVHLKSGCWEGPLDTPLDACDKLKRQLLVLESWIDARAAEGTPFVILGDFNRRFDAPGDEFWQEIDDGKPRNANLRYVTRGETQLCWDREYMLFIDHIVFDRLSARWIQPYTLEELVYQEPTTFKKQLSDHCPAAVNVRVP
jgi:endonuclease/exonuclease/phosphatase family metal-dependent hydrolase